MATGVQLTIFVEIKNKSKQKVVHLFILLDKAKTMKTLLQPFVSAIAHAKNLIDAAIDSSQDSYELSTLEQQCRRLSKNWWFEGKFFQAFYKLG